MREASPRVARLHAILWGIFSIGGIIAAFFLPVLIYLTGIAYPLGLWPFNPQTIDLSYCTVLDCPGARNAGSLVQDNLLGTLFVFVTIAGSLFHGIFRFQSALTEVGLLRFKRGLEALGYLIIVVGILLLAYYLVILHQGFLGL